MNLTLTARHLDITPHLRAHVSDKMRKLERYNEQITGGEIVLSRDSIREIAEGRIHLGHALLTAKGEGSDLYIAVNDLMDKLVAQLGRHEGKLRDRKRQPRDKND